MINIIHITELRRSPRLPLRLTSGAIIEYNDIITQRDEIDMASLTIRNLPSTVKERLRVRAAQQGRSMEAEARVILQSALDASPRPKETLTGIMRDLFGPEHGLELEPPRREAARPAPTFDGC